jgi:hypothetical protein
MATWVLAGNRKLNLDQAAWIDRADNGDVHVVFDGALNHTFRGEAADVVWRMIKATASDPVAGNGSAAGTTRGRRRAGRA